MTCPVHTVGTVHTQFKRCGPPWVAEFRDPEPAHFNLQIRISIAAPVAQSVERMTCITPMGILLNIYHKVPGSIPGGSNLARFFFSNHLFQHAMLAI